MKHRKLSRVEGFLLTDAYYRARQANEHFVRAWSDLVNDNTKEGLRLLEELEGHTVDLEKLFDDLLDRVGR